MRKDKKMAIDEHVELANDLAIICHYIDKVNDRLKANYGKTSTLMQAFNKILPLKLSGVFSRIFGELENEYNAIVTDDQFLKHGHIYSNMETRYEGHGTVNV